MDDRPNPDDLLKQIQAGEPARGRLKVFLGYAAGVGKTYAMLEAAHQRQQQGVDVVVGYVETHGRTETEKFLRGLEILPRNQVEYHNVKLPELDLDAVLTRHPNLVLVDEFAHTNAPGSRHPKRYIDVEEILAAGIDVFTTLNIQHLESLNDVVAQVTGVVVRETVPDRVLDEASEIEVIDLPPEELLTRFKEGKVYIPEQAQRAIRQFFRKGNLSALRELSLRKAAEQVDDQMRDYMRTRAISGPWPAGERILVCINTNPVAEKLVRTTRRLADELNAEWFAIYVEVASKPELNPGNRERIGKTLHLAQELGARTRTLTGRTIPEVVLAYARKHNVTKIVVGKQQRPRWREWFNGSIVDQLIAASGDIDVYIVNALPEKQQAAVPEDWRPHRPLSRYLLGASMVAISTLLGLSVRGNLEPANLVMLYLASSVLAAIFLGRGPSLLVSILGVLAFDFFLVPPYFTFAVTDTQYIITFLVLLVVSLVVSSLTVRIREQAEVAIQREAQTSALYNLGSDLTFANNLPQAAEIIISHINQVFGRQVVIFHLVNGRLQVLASSAEYQLDKNDSALATWAVEHDKPAGRGTDTLPAATLHCQPLKTARGLVGVLGIRMSGSENQLNLVERQTLDSFVHQAALAVERASLAEQARQVELLQATEKLQNSLLNSISHDLRTPLVSITGALSSLADDDVLLDETSRRSLIETASGEAERLNRLVGNLLDMSRLEAGALTLRREACDIVDLVGTALDEFKVPAESRSVSVEIPGHIPLVPMDFVLMERVLFNVIDNALKYSPAGSPIEISARQASAFVEIEVADRGLGIPQEDLSRIFDKFYRVHHPDQVTGTGLGLAICKGIVEAHGGFIGAENRKDGGTLITIALPLDGTL